MMGATWPEDGVERFDGRHAAVLGRDSCSDRAEVMLGMLVGFVRLDDLAATDRVLRQCRIALIVGARVGRALAWIVAGWTNARRSRFALPVLIALRPEWPSARTLVQAVSDSDGGFGEASRFTLLLDEAGAKDRPGTVIRPNKQLGREAQSAPGHPPSCARWGAWTRSVDGIWPAGSAGPWSARRMIGRKSSRPALVARR